MTMKTKKTLQHIAAVAVVLITLCLVFAAPVSAEDVTATVSTNEEFKVNVTQDAETIVINLNADVVIYDTAAWNTNALGGDNTKTITINGNGHTLTFHQTNSDWSHVVTENESAVLILNNVNITNSGYNNGPWNRHDIVFNCSVEMNHVFSDKALAFKKNATLTDVVISDVHPESSQTYAIWIQPNGQTISLDGCEIVTDRAEEGGIVINDQYVISTQSPVMLNVKDTKFTIPQSKAQFTMSWEVHGAAIIVESGTASSPIAAVINLENVDITNVADDSVNAVWVINKASFENVQVTGGSFKVVNRNSVASIGNFLFDTLAEAVAEAEAGETVTLLKDVALDASIVIGEGDDITIEGNGKTITSSSHTFLLNGGMLTLGEGLNVKSTSGCAVLITGGKLVTDANLDATSYAAIQGNGNYVGDVIINGGTITGPVAIYHPQNGNLTVNGGSIIGGTGIEIRAGTLIVNGGEISGTDVFSERKHNSGNTVMGVGIAVSQHTTAHKTVAVINGGAISGEYALYEKNLTTGAKDTEALEKITLSIKAGTLTGNIFSENTGAFITGGYFSSNPSAYIAPGMEVVQPGDKYLVQKYVDRSSSSSSVKPEEPEQPEEPVVEPETPAAPGEVAASTEVTDGGEVAFETTVVDEETGEQSAPAAADDEVKGVVLPTGTEGTVEFVPVSEQPAPAGQEENTKRVFEINVPSYKKGEASVIKFQMTVAEIEADGKTAADVALWHYDEETGEWTKLVTSFIIKDGIVYFEAITNDFSPFAIIYEDEPAGDLPTDTPETPEQPEEPASPAPVLAVLAALGAAVVLRRK